METDSLWKTLALEIRYTTQSQQPSGGAQCHPSVLHLSCPPEEVRSIEMMYEAGRSLTVQMRADLCVCRRVNYTGDITWHHRGHGPNYMTLILDRLKRGGHADLKVFSSSQDHNSRREGVKEYDGLCFKSFMSQSRTMEDVWDSRTDRHLEGGDVDSWLL